MVQRDGKPLAGRHPSSPTISMLLGRNTSDSLFPTLKQRQGNAGKKNKKKNLGSANQKMDAER